MRRLPLMLAVLLLVVAAAGMCAQVKPVQTTLTNGLRIVVVESHAAPVVAVRFYVKTGSICEGELLGHGLSHYLEHTVYMGTKTRTRAEIDATNEAIGNAGNAYTSTDHCCYYMTTATPYWETALALTGDVVFNGSFPAELLDNERGVILREIAMDNDQPESRIWDLFNETMFHVHPVRVPIIGYADLLAKTTREELVAYHAERYVPDNVVLSIAGDVTPEAVIAKCRELFGTIPRQPPPTIVLPTEPPQTAARREVRVDARLEKAYVLLGYRTVPVLNPDMYALDVLADVLGSGASSRLDRIVREEKQLVDGIGVWSNTPAYDAGCLVISATLPAEKLPEAESAILAEIERCRTGLITNEELARAKTQKEAQLIYARETTDGLAETVGSDLVTTGDPLFSDRYVAGIRAVTREDVRRVARAYCRPERLCVAILTPKAPTAATAKVEQAAGPARTVKKTLPNGLTVLVQQRGSAPTVALIAVARGGVRFETAKDNGISAFTADMLVRGTKKRTREALAQAVEDLGAGLSPFSGSNALGVSAKGKAEDLDRLLELMADVLMNATFPAREFEAQRHFTLAAIEAQKDDPYRLARKLFQETMWTVHPYRLQAVGTEESIKALARERVADFYARTCRPNRMVLACVGDVDPQAAQAAIEKALGNWQPGKGEDPTPPAEPRLETKREASLDRDQEQAIVTIGLPGVTVSDPRRYAIDVLDAVMSGKGSPGGRLYTILRRQQLVYAAEAHSESGIDPGAFVIFAATMPGKVPDVLASVRQVVTELCTTLVPDEELARGKQMCTAEYEIGLQDNASRAQAASLDELYGLGYDNYEKYAARIGQVTAEDVRRAAQELLDLDRCVITVAGPKERQVTGDR